MDCPISKISVGSKCRNCDCWLWHKNAKGNCVADDVGNTHILPIDVSRIYNESIEETDARIERGRNKMSAWLALLEKLEEIQEGGCSACGAPKCNKGNDCINRRRKISILKKRLPFEVFVKMIPARWYAVLKASYSENAAFLINLEWSKQ